MTKYVLIYKRDIASDWTKFPEVEKRELIQAWNDWIARLGAARIGGGAFKFGGRSATRQGAKDADNRYTGFAIVEAGSMEEAEGYALEAPMVKDGTGTLEVYEWLSL